MKFLYKGEEGRAMVLFKLHPSVFVIAFSFSSNPEKTKQTKKMTIGRGDEDGSVLMQIDGREMDGAMKTSKNGALFSTEVDMVGKAGKKWRALQYRSK